MNALEQLIIAVIFKVEYQEAPYFLEQHEADLEGWGINQWK